MPTPVHLPGIFGTLAPLLSHYGYLAVGGFVLLEDFGVPLPGETVLVAGALYAGAGRLNVVVVAIVAFVAAVAGDNIGYLIGRYAGHAAVVRWGRHVLLTEARLERAEAFFQRRGGRIVTVARFVDGLRQVNGIVAGIVELGWLRFLSFNALGAALWVGCWVAVGSLAGDHITTIYHWLTRAGVYVLVALAVTVGAVVVRRLSRRADDRRPDPAPGP